MSLSETYTLEAAGIEPRTADRVTWVGHSTVLVELAGERVLTDPVFRRRVAHLHRAAAVAPLALRPVDLVLISHVHQDHLDLPSLRSLPSSTRVIVPRGAGRLLGHRGFRDVVELTEGEAVDAGPLRVRAVHAEHVARRPPLLGRIPSLGYVVEGGGLSVYFAGDTDLFDGMSDVCTDLGTALIPVAGWGPRLGPGHLDPARAARALALLRPVLAIPIHWGTYWPMYSQPPGGEPGVELAELAAGTAPEVEVHVLPVGGSCPLAGRRERT